MTEYLDTHGIAYSVIINNLQVGWHLLITHYNLSRVLISQIILGLILFDNNSPVCHNQELLDEERAEMEMNQRMERSTRSFNFGAYHRLETVGNTPLIITDQDLITHTKAD